MPLPDDRISIENLRDYLTPKLNNIDQNNLGNFLNNHGATDINDLISILHRQYPILDATKILTASPRLNSLLQGKPVGLSEGEFEKNQTHDKTGHEKTTDGYDAAPHSKTY